MSATALTAHPVGCAPHALTATAAAAIAAQTPQDGGLIEWHAHWQALQPAALRCCCCSPSCCALCAPCQAGAALHQHSQVVRAGLPGHQGRQGWHCDEGAVGQQRPQHVRWQGRQGRQGPQVPQQAGPVQGAGQWQQGQRGQQGAGRASWAGCSEGEGPTAAAAAAACCCCCCLCAAGCQALAAAAIPGPTQSCNDIRQGIGVPVCLAQGCQGCSGSGSLLAGSSRGPLCSSASGPGLRQGSLQGSNAGRGGGSLAEQVAHHSVHWGGAGCSALAAVSEGIEGQGRGLGKGGQGGLLLLLELQLLLLLPGASVGRGQGCCSSCSSGCSCRRGAAAATPLRCCCCHLQWARGLLRQGRRRGGRQRQQLLSVHTRGPQWQAGAIAHQHCRRGGHCHKGWAVMGGALPGSQRGWRGQGSCRGGATHCRGQKRAVGARGLHWRVGRTAVSLPKGRGRPATMPNSFLSFQGVSVGIRRGRERLLRCRSARHSSRLGQRKEPQGPTLQVVHRVHPIYE